MVYLVARAAGVPMELTEVFDDEFARIPMVNMAWAALLEGGVAGTVLAAACRRWARHPTILHDALSWQLPDTRWGHVLKDLEAIKTAPADEDWHGLQDDVYDLELSGPQRVVSLRDVSPRPPPRPVRERINDLVHRLEARAPSRTRERETADREPDRDAP